MIEEKQTAYTANRLEKKIERRVVVAISLPEGLLERLDKYVKERETNRSKVVTRELEKLLKYN